MKKRLSRTTLLRQPRTEKFRFAERKKGRVEDITLPADSTKFPTLL